MGKTEVSGCAPGGVNDLYLCRDGAGNVGCVEMCREWHRVRAEA